MKQQVRAVPGNDVNRLIRRWRRRAGMERKLYDTTMNPDSKARSYGAWLAYRECVADLIRESEPL